jgi:hypothetical protein
MGNNILSYFIRNIKDKKERSYYKQKKDKCLNYVKILYKDEIILCIKGGKTKIIWNYRNNIHRLYQDTYYRFSNNKLFKDGRTKILFCNNELDISNYEIIFQINTTNKFKYSCICRYKYNNTFIFSISYKYSKRKKYKSIYLDDPMFYFKFFYKFHKSIVLIKNKYELHYYSNLFYLYNDNK